MKLPSDKLYIPRISIREGVIQNTPVHTRRMNRLARLRRIRTLIGAALIFSFMLVMVILIREGAAFFEKRESKAHEELPLQLYPPSPSSSKTTPEPEPLDLSRRGTTRPPEPMPVVIPDIPVEDHK